GGDGGEAKVVMIDVRGLIADRREPFLIGRGGSPVDDLVAQLRKAEKDSAVKAVVLRINSPGGTVTASDVMYREVRRFAEESGKPVVASMSEIAASGGYYLALAADYMMAEPTTITGSIGVLIPTVNVSEGLGRIGIKSRSVVSRPNKDIANPLEPMVESHYAILQQLVDEYYALFRQRVIERRGGVGPSLSGLTRRELDASRIDELTDGRVVTGASAEAAGLVDATGGVHEAFEAAKSLAGVKKARLVKYHREDEDKPRSPYASAPVGPAETGGTEINLLQLQMNGGIPGGVETAGAYYL